MDRFATLLISTVCAFQRSKRKAGNRIRRTTSPYQSSPNPSTKRQKALVRPQCVHHNRKITRLQYQQFLNFMEQKLVFSSSFSANAKYAKLLTWQTGRSPRHTMKLSIRCHTLKVGEFTSSLMHIQTVKEKHSNTRIQRPFGNSLELAFVVRVAPRVSTPSVRFLRLYRPRQSL